MNCWKCRSACDEKQQFCLACGTRLHMTCPECGAISPLNKVFCVECGFDLTGEGKSPGKSAKATGERKHVTALFADVSGYTALSERLDPEEAKDIMNRFFAEIARILTKYEGFIEKFAGDAVLALFGVPTCHEDDPVRSIRAAIEIHHAMVKLSDEFQDKAGGPLSVHVGINTGLVITGGIRPEDGLHHVSGDTLNVASWLCGLARGGETLVGHLTYSQTEGFFFFERLDPAIVKGRVKPVLVYRLLSAKETPSKTHRVSGLRAGLVGRRTEMARLEEGMQDLLAGKGSVIAICGEAGTGKSRLIEEFKSALNPDCVQWYEGSAYAYSQNIAYFPVADLLRQIFKVEAIDSPEKAAEKVENRTRAILAGAAEVLPYLWEILSIRHLWFGDINPDAFKTHLHRAILTFFSGLIRSAPTIIILEDLHWADPSSLELFPFLVARLNNPILFLCTYRPPLTLFHGQQLQGKRMPFSEMLITELSPPEVQLMIRSLLGTDLFPASLQRFIDEKVGGNPFYLEEVINSLVESELLVYRGGQWHFDGSVNGRALPATIQGVINSRLDRLEPGAKELLQEASVIGRVFYAEILKEITSIEQSPDQFLEKLRELDLI
ncbi:MAG: AAA family ATPase, partial [Syntrophobacteraceae bacterium]